MDATVTLLFPSFIAGLLMFLAPCTLPLVPAYLAFISGVSEKDLTNSSQQRRKIWYNSLGFVTGFTTVFVLFGILAGLFGTFIGPWRSVLTQVGGVFIIVFGLMMLNLFSFAPLQRDYKMSLPKFLTPGNPVSAYVIGAIFAIGWTPCIGPILASILLLASTTATVLDGGFLLLVFSIGLSIPFLLTAFAYQRATKLISTYSHITKGISMIGGVFLIGIGVLLLTNSFGLTVEYGYVLFDWLGLEILFDYL